MLADPLSPGDVKSLRDLFPIVAECTYLVNHSLDAMPEAYAVALGDYGRVFATRGVRAWNEAWWDCASPTALRRCLRCWRRLPPTG